MKKAEYFILEHYSNGKNNTVRITRSEAERAIYAQVTGRVFLGKDGSIAGNNISSVKADLHRAMGFNADYRMNNEDYAYVKRDAPEYLGAMEYVNEKVKYLIDHKQENLIGTDFVIPELEKPKELSKLSEGIAKKFQIDERK